MAAQSGRYKSETHPVRNTAKKKKADGTKLPSTNPTTE